MTHPLSIGERSNSNSTESDKEYIRKKDPILFDRIKNLNLDWKTLANNTREIETLKNRVEAIENSPIVKIGERVSDIASFLFSMTFRIFGSSTISDKAINEKDHYSGLEIFESWNLPPPYWEALLGSVKFREISTSLNRLNTQEIEQLKKIVKECLKEESSGSLPLLTPSELLKMLKLISSDLLKAIKDEAIPLSYFIEICKAPKTTQENFLKFYSLFIFQYKLSPRDLLGLCSLKEETITLLINQELIFYTTVTYGNNCVIAWQLFEKSQTVQLLFKDSLPISRLQEIERFEELLKKYLLDGGSTNFTLTPFELMKLVTSISSDPSNLQHNLLMEMRNTNLTFPHILELFQATKEIQEKFLKYSTSMNDLNLISPKNLVALFSLKDETICHLIDQDLMRYALKYQDDIVNALLLFERSETVQSVFKSGLPLSRLQEIEGFEISIKQYLQENSSTSPTLTSSELQELVKSISCDPYNILSTTRDTHLSFPYILELCKSPKETQEKFLNLYPFMIFPNNLSPSDLVGLFSLKEETIKVLLEKDLIMSSKDLYKNDCVNAWKLFEKSQAIQKIFNLKLPFLHLQEIENQENKMSPDKMNKALKNLCELPTQQLTKLVDLYAASEFYSHVFYALDNLEIQVLLSKPISNCLILKDDIKYVFENEGNPNQYEVNKGANLIEIKELLIPKEAPDVDLTDLIEIAKELINSKEMRESDLEKVKKFVVDIVNRNAGRSSAPDQHEYKKMEVLLKHAIFNMRKLPIEIAATHLKERVRLIPEVSENCIGAYNGFANQFYQLSLLYLDSAKDLKFEERIYLILFRTRKELAERCYLSRINQRERIWHVHEHVKIQYVLASQIGLSRKDIPLDTYSIPTQTEIQNIRQEFYSRYTPDVILKALLNDLSTPTKGEIDRALFGGKVWNIAGKAWKEFIRPQIEQEIERRSELQTEFIKLNTQESKVSFLNQKGIYLKSEKAEEKLNLEIARLTRVKSQMEGKTNKTQQLLLKQARVKEEEGISLLESLINEISRLNKLKTEISSHKEEIDKASLLEKAGIRLEKQTPEECLTSYNEEFLENYLVSITEGEDPLQTLKRAFDDPNALEPYFKEKVVGGSGKPFNKTGIYLLLISLGIFKIPNNLSRNT